MQRGFTATILIPVIALIILVIGGIYFFRPDLFQPKNTNQVNTYMSSSPVAVESNPSLGSTQEYPVSFANINGKIYLLYKGEIYKDGQKSNEDPLKVTDIKADQFKWTNLVDSPIKTPTANFFSDEVFDFKILPGNKDFLFTMRWNPDESGGQNFNVYYYQTGISKYPLKPINDNKWVDSTKKYWIPRIGQVSPEGKFVMFDLYGCWNCGGHQPITLLVNLSSGQVKEIGKVINFKWKDNGEYEYKEYKELPCPSDQTPSYGPCTVDPASLPLLTGKVI